MKVKVKELTTVEKELDLEYPIYLYYQSELGEDEVIKVMPKYKISVFFTLFGVKIKQEKHYNNYTEHEILNNQTTEEHFEDSFEEALQDLVKLKAGL